MNANPSAKSNHRYSNRHSVLGASVVIGHKLGTLKYLQRLWVHLATVSVVLRSSQRSVGLTGNDPDGAGDRGKYQHEV